jgi:fatty acid desaturase
LCNSVSVSRRVFLIFINTKKKERKKEEEEELWERWYIISFCLLLLLLIVSLSLWLLAVVWRLLARVTNECLVSAPNPIQSNIVRIVLLSLLVFLFFFFFVVFPFCFSVSKDWPVGSTAGRATTTPNNNYILSFLPSFLCVYLTLIFFFFSRNRNIVSLSLSLSVCSKSKNGVFCLIPSNKNGFQLDR